MPHFTRNQFVPAPPEKLWAFFVDASSIQKMAPSIPGFEILSKNKGTLEVGQTIKYQIKTFPGIKRRWFNRITECVELNRLAEKQISGPFRYWHHRLEFENRDNGVWMTNHVHFKIGNGIFSKLAYKYCVRPRLEEIFDFRTAYIEKNFGASPALKGGVL